MADKLQIYRARRGLIGRTQYRARIVAGNGKRLFVSSEGYSNVDDLLKVTDRLFPTLHPEGLALRDSGDVR